MIDELKEKFGSLVKALDILYVIEGAKPCSRIMIDETEYAIVKKFLEKKRLYADKSDFKVLKLDKGNFSNKGEVIDANDGRKGHYFVYVSKDKEIIKKARKYEKDKDNINLGLTLGYPKCCCEFFDDNSRLQEKRFNDYVLPALYNSEGFIFPFQNNYAARYFDLDLLGHFPCNFNCRKSSAIGKRHLKIIEKHSKEYAAILRGMLKGAVVYTENYGVFLLRNCTLSGNGKEIRYNMVMGTASNKLSDLLKANNRIKVIDKHHIKIGTQGLETKNFGVMLFI